MNVHSQFKDYKVYMKPNLSFLEKLIKIDNAMYVIDKIVYELYRKCFSNISSDRLVIINAVETDKNINTALYICEKMTELPAKRNACLISIGGGIIQDITGFVANILYRGIRWIFVPTTLLSGCDSCIGGKTSLNYKNYKNLLGTFYPPDEIYICPYFYRTLTDKDFCSGLGEVIKFNIMLGESGLSNIENNIDSLLARNENCLHKFIISSLEFKKWFIEYDEFDKGERIKLNFAHTFGHAIESITKYEIPHGTAVAIGMIMANYIAVERNLLTHDIAKRSEQILLKIIKIGEELFKCSTESFIDAMHKDKKQISPNLTVVLMTNEAKNLKIVHDVQVEEVEKARMHFSSLYKKWR